MRKMMMSLGLVAAMALPAFGAAGDWWILPIDRLDGSFTTLAGAGYAGTDAKQGDNADGVRRVWWSTGNVHSMSAGAAFPAGPELFTIEAFVPTTGALDWQPIEVQYNGYGGDVFPIDPNIPWGGMFGTNHQYLGSGPGAGARGTWHAAGPGPQSPAGGSEVYMTGGSVLYAKWDFPWDIHRAWSMVRITQVTPEPGSILLLIAGGAALLRRKPKAVA